MTNLKLNKEKDDYEGVYSKYSRSTPKYLDKSDNNNTRVLPRNSSITGDDLKSHFEANIPNSIAGIRLLPVTNSPNDSTYFTYADTSEGKVNTYIGFFLVQVSEEMQEKYETVPLPGDSFTTFFYGAQPQTISFSGLVCNTLEDNWRDAFELLYRNYIRGTAATRQSSVVQIKYMDRVVTGYVISLSQQLDAQNPALANFTLTMTVRDVAYLSVKNVDDTLLYYSAREDLSSVVSSSKFSYLDSTKLNAIRNYVRTGTITPPPRPKIPRKGLSVVKQRNCFIAVEDDTAKVITMGNVVDDVCMSRDVILSATADANNKAAALEELVRQAKVAGKPVDPGKYTELTNEVKASQQKIAELKDPNTTQGKKLKAMIEDEVRLSEGKKTYAGADVSTLIYTDAKTGEVSFTKSESSTAVVTAVINTQKNTDIDKVLEQAETAKKTQDETAKKLAEAKKKEQIATYNKNKQKLNLQIQVGE